MTSCGLILIEKDGNESDTKFNQSTVQLEDYCKAKIDERDGYVLSFYVVYSKFDFQGQSSIIKSGDPVDVGFYIRSYQGYDTQGIALFTDFCYCGQGAPFTASDEDITDQFPVLERDGASSLIVSTGTWRLYSAKNYEGKHLGDYTKGTASPVLWYNDMTESIKIL